MSDIETGIIHPNHENAKAVVALRRSELAASGVVDPRILDKYADPSDSVMTETELELMGAEGLLAYIGAYRQRQLVGYMTLTHLMFGHVKPFMTPLENLGMSIGTRDTETNTRASQWRRLEGDQLIIKGAATYETDNRTDVFAHLLTYAIANSANKDILIKHRPNDPAIDVSTQQGFETTNRMGFVKPVERELYIRRRLIEPKTDRLDEAA